MLLDRVRRTPLGALSLLILATPFGAQAAPRPQATFIQDVHVGRERTEANKKSLYLRDGRIVHVFEAGTPPPKGVRIIDGRSFLCLPAFLDAYTNTGCETPEPLKDRDVPVDVQADVRVDMRQANRKGVQPAFRAVEVLAIEEASSEAWREAGFGAALVAPKGELLAGKSALVTTREAAARDLVVAPEVFAHAAFAANGPGYPSTLMGYMAQLRQFFLDAEHHDELVRRYEQGRPGPRPPHDDELEAGRSILARKTRLVCEAETSRDIERWLKLADQFGFEVAIGGGRDAWRVADQLAERDVPVLLTLDWGKEVEDPLAKDKKKKKKGPEKEEAEAESEPEGEAGEPAEADDEAQAEEAASTAEDERVWTYEEPLQVRLERRHEWERGRDCALRLAEAGVRFAFGSKARKPAKLLADVRTLVENGLDAKVAEKALTIEAARILGVGQRLGRVANGYDATFVLWNDDPLVEKKAQPVWVFVDGFPNEYEVEEDEDEDEGDGEGPAEGIDLTGDWEIVFEDTEGIDAAQLTLEMDEDGTLTGTLTVENPRDESQVEADVEGRVSGEHFELSATISFGEFALEVSFEGLIEDGQIVGDATFSAPFMSEPSTNAFTATRTPQR